MRVYIRECGAGDFVYSVKGNVQGPSFISRDAYEVERGVGGEIGVDEEGVAYFNAKRVAKNFCYSVLF